MHEPTAPELQTDEALPALFDEGTQVGEAACTYVPAGVLIDLPYNAYAERIAGSAALRSPPPRKQLAKSSGGTS